MKKSALSILKKDHVFTQHRLWDVCSNGLIDDRTLRLFAVWCARQALALVEPDQLSLVACEVAERYANGYATEAERDIAWKQAAYSDSDGSRFAAKAGPINPVSAFDAVKAASRETCREDAKLAAIGAYRAASRAACWACDNPGEGYAARVKAGEKQVKYLTKMIENQFKK